MLNKNGFASLGIIITIVVILLAGGAYGVYVASNNEITENNQAEKTTEPEGTGMDSEENEVQEDNSANVDQEQEEKSEESDPEETFVRAKARILIRSIDPAEPLKVLVNCSVPATSAAGVDRFELYTGDGNVLSANPLSATVDTTGVAVAQFNYSYNESGQYTLRCVPRYRGGTADDDIALAGVAIIERGVDRTSTEPNPFENEDNSYPPEPIEQEDGPNFTNPDFVKAKASFIGFVSAKTATEAERYLINEDIAGWREANVNSDGSFKGDSYWPYDTSGEFPFDFLSAEKRIVSQGGEEQKLGIVLIAKNNTETSAAGPAVFFMENGEWKYSESATVAEVFYLFLNGLLGETS